tara:strand:- start:5350 stop:6147 length:798 start_codon:yes stop_codon:yes gene_type:complete
MKKFNFKDSKIKNLNAKAVNLILEPFPICSVDNFLDSDHYKELYESFPSKDFFTNPNPDKGNKIALDARSQKVLEYIDSHKVWKEFTQSINSSESSDFFKKLLNSHIPKRNNFKDRKWITDTNFYKDAHDLERTEDANYIRYSFEFSYMKNGSYIPPHTDSENKVISMIFYFADPDFNWSNYDCGTSFFKTNNVKNSEFKSWESVHLEDKRLEKFYNTYSEFHYSEFKANKFLLFIKSDSSWHEVRTLELPDEITRKAFIVNIFC